MLEELKVKMQGFVKLVDLSTGEVLFDGENAVHPENMALAIAQSLGNKSNKGPVERMVFGNGGAYVNGVGAITYLSKNTIGSTATLYNQTYSKIVDSANTLNVDSTRNYTDYAHVNGNLFSDLIVVCTLEYGEPSGENTLDNSATTTSGAYFNEIGLQDYEGRLLTHITFSPVEKSSNRVIQIQYTLRIQMV